MSKEQNTKEEINDANEETAQPEETDITTEDSEEVQEDKEDLKQLLDEANDKYVRLYADFVNYKKIADRNKEELLKYANEEIITDILTVIDHLELALHHSSEGETSSSLAEGVNLTLKELKNVLEKHGLITIDALGKSFDPAVHHAISQIESEDAEENTIVKEFRKGYMLKERVLRAAMVGVSAKPAHADEDSNNSQ
jgi:molecular chaperone GrpE